MEHLDTKKEAFEVITSVDQQPDIELEVVEKHRLTRRVDSLEEVESSRGWFGSLVQKASVLRIEERGIERVREDDRVKQSVLTGYTVWATANFT